MRNLYHGNALVRRNSIWNVSLGAQALIEKWGGSVSENAVRIPEVVPLQGTAGEYQTYGYHRSELLYHDDGELTLKS